MNKKFLFYFFVVLTVIEGIILLITTINLPSDTKNAIVFGLSMKRLIVFLFFLLCIGGFLAILFFGVRIQNLLAPRFNSSKSNKIVTAIGVISFFLLWVTIFTPTKYLYEYEGLFIRIKPAFIWLELILLQSVLWLKISKKTFSVSVEKSVVDTKVLVFAFLPLLLLWVIISITKVGLVKETAYWNVPGIPLSMIQILGILLFLILGLIFSPQKDDTPLPYSKVSSVLIPIGIFVAAVLIWGLTPMLKHFFSLQPTPPNMQPYPYSDARVHDLGALSIVMGKGIYFHGYTDKPLYMLFLAILHVFTGNDYVLLQWAQILVLAFTPVALYQFGKRYFSTLFGIIIAAMLVFQQRNAIALSYKVASVNPKLLVSEELMLLGIVLVTYLLFQWMRFPEPKKVFLLGGLIGALSLVRINPIFIVPAIALIILIKFWKAPKLLFKQIVLLGVGFILVFSPWLFTGINTEGKSWFFLKIQDVIENRYPKQVEVIPQQRADVEYISVSHQDNPATRNVNFSGSFKQETSVSSTLLMDNKTDDLAWVMFNHFLHNFSTSLLALPDSITVYSANDLSAREYWQDENHWDGNFPAGQYLLILANLFILGSGIAYCWKKYHWAGLTPLIVFLAYDLSLSAALNSGSRYIVPINWIIFFYYVLGLILAGRFLLALLGIKTPTESTKVAGTEPASSKASFKSWLPVLTTLVILALLVPAANLVVPEFIHSDGNAAQLLDYAKSKEPAKNQLINGKILYPYYQEDGSISFDFLDGTQVISYSVSQKYLISHDPIVLESEMPALLSATYNDGKVEIKSIFLLEENTPQLFWQNE